MPLLLTLSSGVQGFTTIHSGSARQALTRLRFICQLSEAQLPLSALNTLVSESIDVVVHCTRGPSGPRVAEVVAVEDLAATADAAQLTVTPLFERASDALVWTGNLPVRAERALRGAGFDLRHLLGGGNPESSAASAADLRDRLALR